jgi:hypothetical protein
MHRLVSASVATLLALTLALPATSARADDEYVFEGVLEEGDVETSDAGQAASYVDFYDISVEEGEEIRFVVALESLFPWALIYDPSGTLIYGSPGSGEYSMQVDWKAPGTGTYKFGVAATYKDRQPYTLTISSLPPGTVQEYQRQ